MKYRFILIFIGWCLAALPIRAVNYGTHHRNAYQSSQSWGGHTSHAADMNTMTAKPSLNYTQNYTGLSLSDISEMNFRNLNEAEASGGRGPMFVSRPDGPAVGEGFEESPIGDALLPLLLLLAGYAVAVRHRKKKIAQL